jgi:hypothetical protein
MNADFENRLQRHPLREPPRDWRADILAAVVGPRLSGHTLSGRAALPRRPELGRSSSFALPADEISVLGPGEGASAWPSLRAWAALAAVWVVIFLLHFTAPDEPRLARSSAPMTMQSLAMMREQTLIMAQLLGQGEPTDAAEPPAALPAPPKPRSEIARKQLVG